MKCSFLILAAATLAALFATAVTPREDSAVDADGNTDSASSPRDGAAAGEMHG